MLASVIFTSIKTVCKLPWAVGGWTPRCYSWQPPPAYVVSSPSRGWQVPKRPHHTQCSWWRPSLHNCCCDSHASIKLETTSRKIQPHVAQSRWIGSETTEHQSFLYVEEGSLPRTLSFDCGHSYSQEECATKRESRGLAQPPLLPDWGTSATVSP